MTNVLEVRGPGLIIGIALPEQPADAQKTFLVKHRIFTGTANQNIIRLLPALNLSQVHADRFLEGFGKVLMG
jgi:acetylornithine/N-succinyldiaminopimelate aminotransferase